MSTYVDNILDELLRGIYPSPERGQYTPTLVIGLGGTGLKTLRYLKKNLVREQAQNVRLLGIDSDDGENKLFPELPRLADSELLILDSDCAIRALARAEKGSPDYQFINDFLPDESGDFKGLHQAVRGKIQLRKGAGQFRRAGKLLFCSNVSDGKNLNRVLKDIRVELLGQRTILEKSIAGISIDEGSRVYVVSSLAGGTGAGCLVDLLGLLRLHFNGPKDIVTTLCLLPGDALDKELSNPREEEPNTRGNAIGVLRELQGFMLGQMPGHSFVFDAHTHLKLGTKNLVNCVYLVADTQWDGTPIERWKDMCRAVACFLYGVVGNGVGTSQEAGAVNHDIGDAARQSAIPGLFNALGVGVVEYPLDEIGAYAVRSTVDQLLKGWLDTKVTAGEVRAIVTEINSSIGADSLEDLRGFYDFNTASVPDARFLSNVSDRKTALRASDGFLIGSVDTKMSEIDGKLAGYDEQLALKTQAQINRFASGLDQRARTLITGNQARAQQVVLGVKASVQALQSAFAEEHAKREAQLKKVLKSVDDLKQKVDDWDYLLDRLHMRPKLVAQVNKYLELRVQAKVDEHLAGLLTRLGQVAADIATKVVNVGAGLSNICLQNRDRMEESLRSRSRPGFVQQAMDFDAIPAWTTALKMPLREDFMASSLDETSALREALAQVEDTLRRGLMTLDLVADAQAATKDGKNLKARLRAMDTASKVLIHLEEEAPAESDLQPRKFLVAAFPEGDQALAKDFAAPASGKLTCISIENQHFAMCMRTLHEFGAAHWTDYADAVRYYRMKEWYYHALPDGVSLPPLEVLGDDEADALCTVGLALMTESLFVRGSNYYANLAYKSGEEESFFYLLYQKELSAVAQDLIARALVKPARTSQLKPRPEQTVANSLEQAVQAVRSPKWSDLVRNIRELIADYRQTAGHQELAQRVKDFVETGIDAQLRLAKAGTGRRENLEKIAQALLAYAERLG